MNEKELATVRTGRTERHQNPKPDDTGPVGLRSVPAYQKPRLRRLGVWNVFTRTGTVGGGLTDDGLYRMGF